MTWLIMFVIRFYSLNTIYKKILKLCVIHWMVCIVINEQQKQSKRMGLEMNLKEICEQRIKELELENEHILDKVELYEELGNFRKAEAMLHNYRLNEEQIMIYARKKREATV